jgi:hypothetical protein
MYWERCRPARTGTASTLSRQRPGGRIVSQGDLRVEHDQRLAALLEEPLQTKDNRLVGIKLVRDSEGLTPRNMAVRGYVPDPPQTGGPKRRPNLPRRERGDRRRHRAWQGVRGADELDAVDRTLPGGIYCPRSWPRVIPFSGVAPLLAIPLDVSRKVRKEHTEDQNRRSPSGDARPAQKLPDRTGHGRQSDEASRNSVFGAHTGTTRLQALHLGLVTFGTYRSECLCRR